MEKLSPIKRKEMQKLAERIYKVHHSRCHFAKSEIECLLIRFYLALCDQNERLDRIRFTNWLHNDYEITDDLIMDRVFRVFDKDNDGNITPEEFVLGLSVFMRGTFHDRIHYSFKVYDLNDDGYISADEMVQMLRECLPKNEHEDDPDDGVKELVDMCLRKLHKDNENRVSLESFTEGVSEEPLMLEAFGQCLPSERAMLTFEEMLSGGTPMSTFQPVAPQGQLALKS